MNHRTIWFAALTLAISAAQGAEHRVPEPETRAFELRWQAPWMDLTAIDFADESHGWAVGNLGNILVTSDGETWQPIATPSPRRYLAVDFAGELGWAVGERGAVLHRARDGGSWERRDVDTGGDLWTVHVFDAEHLVVGGETGIFFTGDGGSSWEPAPVYLAGTQDQDLDSFLAVVGMGFWPDGEGLAVTTKGLLLSSTNRGREWRFTRVLAGNPGRLSPGESPFLPLSELPRQRSSATERYSPVRIRALSPSFGLGVLEENGAWMLFAGALLRTGDRGATWEVSRRFVDWGTLSDTGRGLVSRNGILEATADGGESWQEFDAEPHGGIETAYLDARGQPWLIAAGGIIWHSPDGGSSWAAQRGVGATGLQNGRFPASFDLANHPHAMAFRDAERGFAVGDARSLVRGGSLSTSGGAILKTEDGGLSWVQMDSGTPSLNAIALAGSSRAWAVGWSAAVVTSIDSGTTWQVADATKIPAEGRTLTAVRFLDESRGWIGGYGILLETTDGGGSWTRKWLEADEEEHQISSIFFFDRQRGWATELFGGVLLTRDGGQTWQRIPAGTAEDVALNSVTFLTPDVGVLGTEAGLLVTRDGGLTWQAAGSAGWNGSEYLLNAFAANRLNAWLIGDEGGVTSTADGGISWKTRYLLADEDLYWGGFFDGEARVFGDEGLLLVGDRPDYAPHVERIHVDETAGGVAVAWTVVDEAPKTVQCTRVEFRPEAGQWQRLERLGYPLEPAGDGWFGFDWVPDSKPYYSPVGKKLHYRVTLRDARGTSYTHEIARGFVYRPWWDRQSQATRTAVVVVSLVAAYVLAVLLLLWASPRAVLWLHRALPLDTLPATGVTAWILKAVVGSTLLPRLVKSARVRRAWIRDYESGKASFDDLEPGIRRAYLGSADCLDAWVAQRLEAATDGFHRTAAVRERRIFIPLPVAVGPVEESELIPEPTGAEFRPLLEEQPRVLLLIGRGGAGKSTLACQIGDWALQGELGSHPAIPIFVEEETDDLPATIRQRCRELVGSEGAEDDVIAALLSHRRLLVIIDALSERTAKTAEAVRATLAEQLLAATIITTRRQPDLGPLKVIEVRPQPLDVSNLVYFLTTYLRRREMESVFPGRRALGLGDRLLSLIDRSSEQLEVTPLLVRLFVDSAIEALDRSDSLDDLPSSIPQTMLEYLERVNPQSAETPNRIDNEEMFRAAKVLGWCSLRGSYQPRDFFAEDGKAALAEAGLSEEVDHLARLEENGILNRRPTAGTNLLRFELDSLAEYLAALYLIDKNRGDPEAWDGQMEEVRQMPGYPQQVHGFLVALEDCVRTYATDFELPEIRFPWSRAA